METMENTEVRAGDEKPRIAFDRKAMLDETARAFVMAENAAWTAMVQAGWYFRTADKVNKAKDEMFAAFLARGLTRGTCENYVSKAHAVSLHFPEVEPEEGESFADFADRVTPGVKAMWGGIRDIRKSGPRPDAAPPDAASTDAEPDPVPIKDTATVLAPDTMLAYLETFLPVAEAEHIQTILDMALTELSDREAEARPAEAA
jgi:hypothetical protein